MDFRGYQPGDDLRRVDWRGYARTDQLQVRLYREEIAPYVDVVLDCSASMSVTEAKRRAALELAHALLFWAARAGGAGRVLAAGGGELATPQAAEFAGSVRARPRVPLRRGGWRIWITDALWADDPAVQVKDLALGAAQLDMIRLLDPWERDPLPEGGMRLVDCETGAQEELVLDETAVAGYRERLQRLEDAVRRALHGVGGRFVPTVAEPFPKMAAGDLAAGGLVEPAP